MSTALARVRILAILVNLIYVLADPARELWGHRFAYLTGERMNTNPVRCLAFYFVVDTGQNLDT
jgi:hypothetical protein